MIRRKKAARPTGRYIAVVNYRCHIPDADVREHIAKCGGQVAPDNAVVMLQPGVGPEGDPLAYDLPEDIAAHGLACGALREELR